MLLGMASLMQTQASSTAVMHVHASLKHDDCNIFCLQQFVSVVEQLQVTLRCGSLNRYGAVASWPKLLYLYT